MREVIVFKWGKYNPETRTTAKEPDGEALFHQFGSNYAEFEEGPGNYSIAIIERANGSIECVDPDLIQFKVSSLDLLIEGLK